MRRIFLVLAVIALLTAAAMPAMADQRDNKDWGDNDWGNNSWSHNDWNNNNSWSPFNNTFCGWYPSWWGWDYWCYSPWCGWWKVW